MSRASHRRSDYLDWVKRRRDRIRYPLSRSGVPRLDVRTLAPTPDFLLENADNEDGWPPVLDVIAARAGLTPQHVCLAVACTGANHVAFGLFLEPGDHVAMETPVYEPLRINWESSATAKRARSRAAPLSAKSRTRRS